MNRVRKSTQGKFGWIAAGVVFLAVCLAHGGGFIPTYSLGPVINAPSTAADGGGLYGTATDDTPPIEAAATRALSAWSSDRAAGTLERILGDPDRSPESRRFAVLGMRTQPQSAEAAAVLIQSYRLDSDPEVHRAALLSLGEQAIGSEGALLELLFALNSDDDSDCRRLAAIALTRVSDTRVENALEMAALGDPVEDVRETAAMALRAQHARSQAVAVR